MTQTDPDTIATIATMAALRGINDIDYAYSHGLVLGLWASNHNVVRKDDGCPSEVMKMVKDWYGKRRDVRSVWPRVIEELVETYLKPILSDPQAHLVVVTTGINPVLVRSLPDEGVPDHTATVPWANVLAHVVAALDKD